MTETIVAEGWITTDAAEALTGYSRQYLRRLATRGRVKARKVASNWLFNRESLKAYQAQMEAMGSQRYNPWRDDLAEGRGRQGGGTERTE